MLTASNIPTALANRPQPQLAPPPFAHGVASGDPISNSVVLWTRITALEAEVTVRWEISSTQDFHTIVATGDRSEERRVGKECGDRWARDDREENRTRGQWIGAG